MLPLTITRRSGAACDAAQNSVDASQSPPYGSFEGGDHTWPAGGTVTLIVRFESERQKFTSSVQPVPSVFWSGGGHWFRTWASPLMTVSLGKAPSPATCS